METVHIVLVGFMALNVMERVPHSVWNVQMEPSVIHARLVSLVIHVASDVVTVRIILLVTLKLVTVNSAQTKCMEVSASFTSAQ
jgi:hypothetical protein